MANRVKEVILGIDVSKRILDVSSSNKEDIRVFNNDSGSIREFLDGFSGPLTIAVEATNTYHELLVDLALERGMTVYLVDGYRLAKYREAVAVRAKTDPSDAYLLRRYLIAERAHLRAWNPQSQQERRLWRLIKRRTKLVETKTRIKLSMSDLDPKMPELTEAVASITRLINRLQSEACAIARALGWQESLARLRTIPGVGELSALALMSMYSRGEFRTVDQFVAFLGLDVRVRDSGTHRGQRKLTKKGDPETRRLLFNGARAAVNRWDDWAKRKQQLMDRGMSEIQVSVILARKIARIGYALLKNNATYKTPEVTCQPS